MIKLSRRKLLLGTAATLAFPSLGQARGQTVIDSAGRSITLPDRIGRVFAAGAPAGVAIYMIRPDAMIGWPRALRPEEKPYIAAAQRDLPELGMLTGRGSTTSVETLLQLKPDLIVDFGSVRETYISLAQNTQDRTGIPYALIDGRFDATPASLRLLGRMLGVPEQGEALAHYTEDLFKRLDAALATIQEDKRPRVYLARGPKGLETGLKGSINTEIVERAGGRNVAEESGQQRNIADVSPEQLLLWNPDIIVTWDRGFFELVTKEPEPTWQQLAAVANKRIYLAPTVPFGWIDRPPSVNRLIGLAWLAHLFHGDRFPFDISSETREFYRQFYHVDLSGKELDTLVAWADGKPPPVPHL
jgi:iron complex transport system substrate-binding protein